MQSVYDDITNRMFRLLLVNWDHVFIQEMDKTD